MVLGFIYFLLNFVAVYAAEQYICEGDTGTINCTNGEILSIQYASYGRWSTTICPQPLTPYTTTKTGCGLNVTAIVRNACSSQSSMTSCKLTATNNIFTDTCPNTYKYLKVGFTCHPATALDPCTHYQEDLEPLRSSGYVVKTPATDHLICDRLLTPGWYRFNSGAGGQMPTSCQDVFHCGTHVPLWMNGAHPTVADGIVRRNICGKQSGAAGCCTYKDAIEVKNCGTFYVYFLTPTRGCSVGYCAGNKQSCPPDKWSPSGFEPGCVDAYPKMTQSPTLSTPILKPNTFELNCHINFDPTRIDVGFDVTWLFDGHPDTNLAPSHITGPTRYVSLDQKYLMGHLGKELSCRADAFFKTSPGRRSPPIASNGYWMGIKMSESRLVVGEHEKPREVKLISTIPIVCDKASAATCHLEIYLEPNNHDFKTTTACTVNLLPTDWNTNTNQAVTKFEVLAERDFKIDHDKNLMLHFSRIFSADAPPVFNNYQIPYLQVITKDKPTSLCTCMGDPHCIPLDNSPTNVPEFNVRRLYSSQRRHMFDYFKLGEFVMYKATHRPFEVQVRTWQCGRAVCNCAVAAREGNDVVMVDMCHGSYGRTFPKVTIPNKSSFSQGTVIQKDKSGNKWVISFPSGAMVSVTNSGGRYMNVYINAPEDDYQKTEGLCGNFDGRRDNDLTAKNGHVYRWSHNGNSFADTWRIPIGTSIFDKPPQPDPKLNNNVYYCNCNQAKKRVDCKVDNKAARPALHTRCPGCQVVTPQKPGHTGRRRQSSLGSNGGDDAVPYFFNYGLLWNPPNATDFPTPSGITLDNATQICINVMKKSSTIGQCTSRAGLHFSDQIVSCIDDIRLTDSLDFIHSGVEAAVISCQEAVLKNLTFYNNSTGQAPSFITSDLCPSDCSGHGSCVQGTCHCNSGYVGDACVINSRKPPVLYNIVGTNRRQKDSDICDVQIRPCEKIYVIGDNIREQTNMTCSLKELKFDNGTFVATGHTFETPLDYETMHNVLCHMPTKSQMHGRTVSGFNISLTNDGRSHSNEVQLFIVDTQCLSCSDQGGKCSIKANTCLIDSVCRKSNEQAKGNSSLHCLPQTSNKKWTLVLPTQPTATKPAKTTSVTHAKTTLVTTDKTTPATTVTTLAVKTTPTTKKPSTSSQTTLLPSTTAASNTQLQNITQWYFAHLPPAPLGGEVVPRFDIWTLTTSGCACLSNTSRTDCACCDVDGCQCPGLNQFQCVQCGHTEKCGNLLPAPDNGIDGYTMFLAECTCTYDTSQTNCACCHNGGCQCGKEQRNQCVQCGHMEQCGNKPWIFGPPYPITK